MDRCDVCILGAGIVGQTLALALSKQGLSVVLVDDKLAPPGPSSQAVSTAAPVPAPAKRDIRVYALSASSVRWLSELKVWDALPASAVTPVLDMLIRGDQAGASLHFSAWQQCVAELASIVDAPVLDETLQQALKFAPHVLRVGPEKAAEFSAKAALVALCEGKHSAARSAYGAQWFRLDLGQTAVSARLSTDIDHLQQARQWFNAPDILALLPLSDPQVGHGLGLVWSVPHAKAKELMAMDTEAFEQALMAATGAEAGVLRLASDRGAFPLMHAGAKPWCGKGWVLLGDAAHVVHPLAGQGLNLGLSDVECLARVLREKESWRDLGDPKLLRRYERERSVPTLAMGQITDGLMHLFAHPSPWVAQARNWGLRGVDALSPIKRWLAGQAFRS